MNLDDGRTPAPRNETAMQEPEPRMSASLLMRVFGVNAIVVLVAVVLLAVSPATVSSPIALGEVVVLVVGVTVMLLLNLYLVRHTFAPLNRVRDLMQSFDPLQPGARLPLEGLAEIREVTMTFNFMAERLEHERRQSSGRILAAQERERRRLAAELHDEIGQSLTGLLLLLGSARRTAPVALQPQLGEAQDAARSSLDDLRRIVKRLRPEALDELGLESALISLAERISEQAGIQITGRLARDLPQLDDQVELVLYRVAQESLTNVVRHAGASRAELRLERRPGGLRLEVTDDGRGLNGGFVGDANGIRGMRERALLIDADLSVGPGSSGGVTVTLDLPMSEDGR
jgi:two-component system sensor histidine kinase UhpB